MNGCLRRVVHRQRPQTGPVFCDQRFLLCPAPALDLHFRSERFLRCRVVLAVGQRDRASVVGVAACNASRSVRRHAGFDVIGMARVVRAVGAAQDVDVESHVRLTRAVRGSTGSPRTDPSVRYERVQVRATYGSKCAPLTGACVRGFPSVTKGGRWRDRPSLPLYCKQDIFIFYIQWLIFLLIGNTMKNTMLRKGLTIF